jgi:tetratricopeptide (TPR) repeat protein
MSAEKNTAAVKQNELGLQHYAGWELDQAIDAFQKAVKLDPDNPEYHLNLARAYARGGNYPDAMQSLGNYLQTETDENVAARYERLFSSALDEVEQALINGMKEMDAPVQQIGKAIQMWLEYRITVGRRPLRVPKPELWAAALAHATGKVNLSEIKPTEIAAIFQVPVRSLQEKYTELVQTLDLMPADYRYFTGDKNPLDKLVEMAQMLDDMYKHFKE